MKKAKIAFFSVIVLCVAVFVSCSFFPDSAGKTPGPAPISEQLERHELLALLHLADNHEVTPEALESKVAVFLTSNATSRSVGSPASTITGVQKMTRVVENGFSRTTVNNRSLAAEPEEAEIPFYLFDIENSTEQTAGYVLTSGDIRFPSVIAVVEDGEFNDEDHPFTPIFQELFANYIRETLEIYNNVTDEDIAAALEKLDRIPDSDRAITNLDDLFSARHEPSLITTTWDQRYPYWDVINSAYGRTDPNKYLVGCVAVATGQIMAYHQKPSKPATTISNTNTANPKSITSFIDPYTNASRSLSSVTYQWANMKASSNAASLNNLYKMQIGVLMFEAGANVKMQYGTGSSSAYSEDVPAALVKMQYYQPTLVNYNITTVIASIDQYKPVYIQGYITTTTGGHAWVIDNHGLHRSYYTLPGGSGPQRPIYTPLVHCNLGWGGSNDGWYVSSIFDTTNGNFQYLQKIIPHITPKP